MLVTGAGRGIGRTIAMAFSEARAAVSNVARTTHQLEAMVDQILEKEGAILGNAA